VFSIRAYRAAGLNVLSGVLLVTVAFRGATSAQAIALLVGPGRVGQTVSYRITTTNSAEGSQQSTPQAATVAITWRTATRFLARLGSDSPDAAPSVLTRGSDGALAIENPNAAELETLLQELDRPRLLAAALGASDHASTTLLVQPPATASTSQPPGQVPTKSTAVPVIVTGARTASGVVLTADGSAKQKLAINRGAGGGEARAGHRGPRGAGGPGGGIGGTTGSPSYAEMTTHVVEQAQFDRTGILEHESWRETVTGPLDDTGTVERTVSIDRIE
jgi:hypothetical protein